MIATSAAAPAPKVLVKLKSLPELRDIATDQQSEGTTLTLTINRDQASRYGLCGYPPTANCAS